MATELPHPSPTGAGRSEREAQFAYDPPSGGGITDLQRWAGARIRRPSPKGIRA
eukprot:gene1745-732_t